MSLDAGWAVASEYVDTGLVEARSSIQPSVAVAYDWISLSFWGNQPFEDEFPSRYEFTPEIEALRIAWGTLAAGTTVTWLPDATAEEDEFGVEAYLAWTFPVWGDPTFVVDRDFTGEAWELTLSAGYERDLGNGFGVRAEALAGYFNEDDDGPEYVWIDGIADLTWTWERGVTVFAGPRLSLNGLGEEGEPSPTVYTAFGMEASW